jgi:hypothetical protein
MISDANIQEKQYIKSGYDNLERYRISDVKLFSKFYAHYNFLWIYIFT